MVLLASKMNKKGVETTTVNFLGALIIAGIIVFIIIDKVLPAILPKSTNEDEEIPIFYYKTLIKEIKDLKNNDIKKTNLALNRNYILVGFSNNLKEINEDSLNEACGKIELAHSINKPSTCEANGCLCICEVDTGLAEFSGGLIVNCESEKSKCELFKENIIGNEKCEYFLYYDAYKKPVEINITKKQDNIILSKTL